MTNNLPKIGVKYSWKHAPQRYFLVIGFFKDKIICIQDRFLDSSDDEALECAELLTLRSFKAVTNFKKWSDYFSNLYTSFHRKAKSLINSIESMLSRQDELEERIKKLEGNDN